jgi:hypothetical protein
MAVCIAADRFHIKPRIIVHRATLQLKLTYSEYSGGNALIARESTALITRLLFRQ